MAPPGRVGVSLHMAAGSLGDNPGSTRRRSVMADMESARNALFDAIESAAGDAAKHSGGTRSAMIRDAAIAWRALVGGQQPGSVVVESSSK